jgi:hypothetical protein
VTQQIVPREGVGVMCCRGAQTSVIEYAGCIRGLERGICLKFGLISTHATFLLHAISTHRYSEMTREMAEARDEKTNKLRFRAANIAIHCFSLSFLQNCAARRNELPYVLKMLFNYNCQYPQSHP